VISGISSARSVNSAATLYSYVIYSFHNYCRFCLYATAGKEVMLSNMLFRIFKMIATSGFLTALKCTKFVSGPRYKRIWLKFVGKIRLDLAHLEVTE